MEKTALIEGMRCPKCAARVEKKISSLAGVKSCRVALEEKKAVIATDGTVPDTAIRAAVEEVGFEVKEVR